MNRMKIYVLLVCLGTILTVQAQNFGSAAMRKLQMAEFAISAGGIEDYLAGEANEDDNNAKPVFKITPRDDQ